MPGGGQSWGCCLDSQAPLVGVASQPVQLVVSNPLLVESLVGGWVFGLRESVSPHVCGVKVE